MKHKYPTHQSHTITPLCWSFLAAPRSPHFTLYNSMNNALRANIKLRPPVRVVRSETTPARSANITIFQLTFRWNTPKGPIILMSPPPPFSHVFYCHHKGPTEITATARKDDTSTFKGPHPTSALSESLPVSPSTKAQSPHPSDGHRPSSNTCPH